MDGTFETHIRANGNEAPDLSASDLVLLEFVKPKHPALSPAPAKGTRRQLRLRFFLRRPVFRFRFASHAELTLSIDRSRFRLERKIADRIEAGEKDAHKESLLCLDAKLEPETVDHFKIRESMMDNMRAVLAEPSR